VQLTLDGLVVVDPHPPQDLDGSELAQHAWCIGGVDRLQEIHPIRSDHLRIVLPLLGPGGQPRIFDPPSVAIEPLGWCQGA
jgi:hypothetical protein